VKSIASKGTGPNKDFGRYRDQDFSRREFVVVECRAFERIKHIEKAMLCAEFHGRN
jgi:hypothetical protein